MKINGIRRNFALDSRTCSGLVRPACCKESFFWFSKTSSLVSTTMADFEIASSFAVIPKALAILAKIVFGLAFN